MAACTSAFVGLVLTLAGMCGRRPAKKAEIEAWDTPAFGGKSVAESVKHDVAIVQQDELLSETLRKGTKGFVFDIKLGVVNEVKV